MTTRSQIKELVAKKLFDPTLTINIIAKIEEAINDNKPLLLDGQAGCGKTAGVYYVANRRKIKVFEFNASDDLRTGENVNRLRNKTLEAHDGDWIILIDEVDKKSNLQLLIEIIWKNKIETSNTTIIAITNYGWTLKKKYKLNDTYVSFIEVFGANYTRVYRPYANQVANSVIKRGVFIPPTEHISNDLRNYEKMILIKDFSNDEPVNFQHAFFVFQQFMSSPSYKRDAKGIPTAKQLGGALETWIIKNGFSNHNQNSFRWHRKEFQRAIELLSLSKMYNSENLKMFLPSFWLQKESYKHPASI